MVNILGIETSCDETGVAIIQGPSAKAQVSSEKIKNLSNLSNPANVVNRDRNIDFDFEILAEGLASSVDLQKEYGGVVPELASRVHVEKINLLLAKCLKQANLDWEDIDAIAVANGPGLVGSLLVGTMVAKTLGMVLGKPLIAVNHLEGHICSAFLEEKKQGIEVSSKNVANVTNLSKITNEDRDTFPMLVLIVSGGHTELLIMKDFGEYEMLGSTVDDASGEAFDKAAKILGLEYPGGPSISRRAAEYRCQVLGTRFQGDNCGETQNGEMNDENNYKLPRPMIDSDDYNFSFSGLKTALLYKWKKLQVSNVKDSVSNRGGVTPPVRDDLVNRMAWEFQEAVVDVLVTKTVKAAEKFKINKVAIVGGVAANGRLREEMEIRLDKIGRQLIVPPNKYCTDNGAKIAVAGYFKYLKNDFTDWKKLEVNSNWEL